MYHVHGCCTSYLGTVYSARFGIILGAHGDCALYLHAALCVSVRSAQLGSALSWVRMATVPAICMLHFMSRYGLLSSVIMLLFLRNMTVMCKGTGLIMTL
jgi:hypothetical protein